MKIPHLPKLHRFILAVVMFAALGFGSHASAQRSYLIDINSKTVTPLENLSAGHTYTIAQAINEAGQVVGFSGTSDSDVRAFITGPGGTGMRDLGTLGGVTSFAYGINDAGQVVGSSAMPGSDRIS